MLGATIGQIVTVDRADDDMRLAHLLDGLGNLFRPDRNSISVKGKAAIIKGVSQVLLDRST
jgi:hypothetical protein